VGILLVLAMVAALVGIATVRGRWWVGVIGALGLGIVGVWAATTGRNTSGDGALPSIVAALVAGGVLWLGWWAARPVEVDPAGAVERPGAGGLDRRRLLATGGALAAGTLALGGIGRALDRRRSNAAARAAIVLPDTADPLPPPPTDPSTTIQGLSPLFTPNRRFYRIDTAIVVPSVDPADWRLRVTGRVERELELTYDDLLALPQVEADITMACVSNEVGGDLVGNARWTGVRLDDLLQQAGVEADADQVMGRSLDGFTAGFPVAALDGRPALVALGMNGEPLPNRHGFPARLVVAGLYGYVSATKWLSNIQLTRFDEAEGYWVPRGWAVEAPIKTQSRIDRPRGMPVDAGSVVVAGVAWAPTRGIQRVEVQVDDGPWRTATLGPSVGDDAWRQWWIEWDATPGKHEVRCRATDGTGETQPEEYTSVAPDGATGWHQVRIDVRG
jgi:DMSO/TMAO reductase YedYZ molybdopterin-dependent catalytic subunit